MTRLDLVRALLIPALLSVLVGQISAEQADTAPPYAPAARAIKLTEKTAAVLMEARTAALVAIDASRLEVVSYDKEKKEATVVLRGGIRRGVSAEKARSELLKSMRDWNRFEVVEDRARADIVIVVFEDTVAPSAFTRSTGDRKHRMRERLSVFAAHDPTTPIWADEVRESTFNAITGSPVGKVVEKFREDLESRQGKR